MAASARLGGVLTMRSDQRPRSGVVGRVPTTWLGAAAGSEYVARDVDDDLAVRLGRDGALVVVTGAPLAGASRTVARAARRMLGSERVVAPGAVSTVDVAELVAALDGPGVVWLDAAPLAVLDQITPTLLGTTRSAGVRVVVTTRPELVGVDHPDPATATLLRDAAVTMGPLTAAEVRGTRYRAGELIGRAVLPGAAAAGFVDPVGWRSVLEPVITSVAATWEVLDVAHPLTPECLVELTRAVLERMDVPPVGEDAMRDAVAQCVRGPEGGVPVLLATRRDGRRHLRAHPSVLDAAMSGSAPFARSLSRAIGDDTTAARCSARTALARGDEVTAVELLRGRPTGGLSPRLAARMGDLALDEASRVAWFREALTTDDADLLRTVRARLGTLLTDGCDDDVAEARELLVRAVPDQRALVALGTLDQRQGRPDDARARWVEAAAGPDAGLAAIGAWHAACVDIEAGRDDDALPLLEHALDGRGALRNGWAGLALARLYLRRGDDDRAEDVLRTVADGADGDWMPCEIDPRDEARFELGRVAEDRGDAAGAAALWKTLPGDPEAVCRLAEHHLRAGRHAEALRELERERPGAPASDVRIEDRWGGHAPDLRAWQAWIAGEVALAQDRRDDARRYFAVARIAPGWRGRWSMLRLAEIAVADGDGIAARSWLDVLGDGVPDEVTDAARRLRHDHAGLLAGGARQAPETPQPRRGTEVSRPAGTAR